MDALIIFLYFYSYQHNETASSEDDMFATNPFGFRNIVLSVHNSRN